MDGIINLGIELYGDTLRYAKVEQHKDAWQLLRLGNYTFDFDIAEAFLSDEPKPQDIAVMRAAIQDMMEESTIQELRIALHPTQACHFYIPVEVNLSSVERAQLFLRDSRKMIGEENKPLHIVPHSLFLEELSNGEQVAWYQISTFHKSAFRRIAQFIEGLKIAQYHTCSVETSVGKVITEILKPQTMTKQAPFVVVTGNYLEHTEFLLCRTENLHFSNYATLTESSEINEHILQMLKRLHFLPQMVGKMYMYGTDVTTDWDAVAEHFGMVPQLITPSLIPRLYSQNLPNSESLSAFIPAIGAAM